MRSLAFAAVLSFVGALTVLSFNGLTWLRAILWAWGASLAATLAVAGFLVWRRG